MIRTIRIGMLGYGFMGRCHTNAFRTIGYMYPSIGVHAQLATLCGRNEARETRHTVCEGRQVRKVRRVDMK